MGEADAGNRRIIPALSRDRKHDGGALAALAASPSADRFCAWRGASDRRYVFSVFAFAAGEEYGLPAFEGFVLALVRRHGPVRQIVEIASVERDTDRRLVAARGAALGIDEWHVFLQARDRGVRAAAVADLHARHAGHEAANDRRCA
jgi:hypothetical protein